MTGRLNVRVKSEAWQYFESKMNLWHLDKTEAFHRMISEIQRLEDENTQQAKDLEIYRQLVRDRPCKSDADKSIEDRRSIKCLRGKRFPYEQAGHFCMMCRQNHSKEFEACQKLEAQR